MGLHRAGFEVVGFDLSPMPRYPFEFHQQDALTVDLSGFDAVWASPPCQAYSIMHNLPWLRGREYPELILPVREMLDTLGKPYAIENVMGARYGAPGLRKRGLEAHGMQAGWLCGGMFGLPFYRHRLFETNWLWLAPGHPKHQNRIRPGRSRAGRARDFVWETGLDRKMPDGSISVGAGLRNWQSNGAQANGVGVGHAKGWRLAAEAMGIDWMKREELTQAIPPAYSEWIGSRMLEAMETPVAFSAESSTNREESIKWQPLPYAAESRLRRPSSSHGTTASVVSGEGRS